jgi:hypothetical protein
VKERWSSEQIEARIALGLDSSDPDFGAEQTKVKDANSCICRNGDDPDDGGLLFISPSCPVHGLRSTFGVRSGLSQRDSRTVASVHNGHRSEG